MPAIRVSSYPLTKWIPVAAPTSPLASSAAKASQSAVGWVEPATTRSYQYALIDENNCAGPWSPPVTFDMAKGQGVIINYDDFVPATAEPIAIIWKTNTGIMLAVGTYEAKQPYYYNPLVTGRRRFQEDWSVYIQYNFQPSTILTSVPPTPKIDRYDVPNIDLEIAYCEVTHTGETELSPPRASAAGSFWGDADSRTFREILFYNIPPPYGSLGRHVYARPAGTTTWYRQPNPQCFPQTGVPLTPEDYLWRHGEQQGNMYHYRTDVVHSPVADPRSEICNLLQARMDVLAQGQVIIVDVAEVKTKTPIYDRYGPGNNEQNLQVIGEYGVQWKLTQDTAPPAGCVNQGTNWPLLLISNQKSKWKDCVVRTTNGWAALAYLEWSGGQCFGNEFHNCNFNGPNRGASMTYASGAAGHTPSEQLFNGCSFSGKVALEITGNQTANVRVNGPTYLFSPLRTRGSSCMLLDTPNQVRFTGDTFFDGGFKAMEIGESTSGIVTFDFAWCDQGNQLFFDGVGRTGQIIAIKGGKLNSWNLWSGSKPFLFRNPCSIWPSQFTTENVQMQHNFGVQKHMKVFSSVYQAFCGLFTNSDLLFNGVKLIEPTWDQQVDLGFKLPMFGSMVNGVWTWSQPPMPKISKTINMEP